MIATAEKMEIACNTLARRIEEYKKAEERLGAMPPAIVPADVLTFGSCAEHRRTVIASIRKTLADLDGLARELGAS